MINILEEYKSLNESQQKAVLADVGTQMVIAGPGSGKTHVIVNRIHYMVKHLQIEPRNILVITFTKAAAEEMKERFMGMKDIEPHVGSQISFGTFHAIFFKMLRRVYGYRVDQLIRDDEKFKLLQKMMEEMEIEEEDPKEYIENFLKEMALMRNNLIDIKYYHPDGMPQDIYHSMVNKYESYKARHNKIDFDDMLTHCYHMLNQDPKVLAYFQGEFQHILIDEFQDINRVQYEVIRLLSAPKNNLFIVGDDDQSIYKFRGARPEFLIRFPEGFPNTQQTVLKINYRSTKNIIKHSNNLIVNNNDRYKKLMETPNKEGNPPIIIRCNDSEDESKQVATKITDLNKKNIPFKEMAVIFRTNMQARSVVDALMDMNIPFYLQDSIPSLYEHWITKDILAYFNLTQKLTDDAAVLRIINKPKRYISKAIVSQAVKISKHGILRDLYNVRECKPWQIDRLEELRFQLQQLRTKKPYDGVKYIRKVIGYDDYLKEYAEYRKIPTSGIIEILNELQEAAKGYETYDQWAAHIEDVMKELKTQKQESYKKTKNKERNGVVLSTMHSAKGLEFEAVFIIGTVEGIVPHSKSNGPDELEEERRLFYVGMTRAKEHLYIYIPEHKYEGKTEESRFIEEIFPNSKNKNK
ncbi:MAG TPA: ATP-dependent helicase [Epulopiscium sp.]|nr:ATP-dependent helicase [Candidatus Epulonipiscium sp.]